MNVSNLFQNAGRKLAEQYKARLYINSSGIYQKSDSTLDTSFITGVFKIIGDEKN